MMKSRFLQYIICSALVSGLCLSSLYAHGEEKIMTAQENNLRIPFEHFTLENGLNVYLIRDNTLPIVTVNLWINVGSKDEAVGRSGFAHLFEHLMFMGTEKVPDIDMLLESGGGSNNASTREDVTNYYTVAPENMLETVLYIEADRFANLAIAMNQDKLNKQRDIVLNERRQSLENQPYGKLWLEMPTALYPKEHPYAHPVIGSVEDIKAATVEDVVSFFNTYYVPNNTTLVIGGDFDEKSAKDYVQKYFSAISKRPMPPEISVPQVTHPAVSRKVIEDEVQVPRVTMIWHSPAFMKAGDAELDIFSNILCKGQNSRLINRLIYQKQIASNVSCGQMSGLSSVFIIDAMPIEGVTIETIEAEILDEMQNILQNGISSDEFERTKNSIETAFVQQLQSIGSRADSFNSHLYYTHSTDFPAGDMKRYREATVDSLMKIVNEIFTDETRRCTLVVVPKESSGVTE